MSSGRILIADDEPSVRDSVGYALAQEGFEVTPAADGDEASSLLGDGIPFDLLILDIMMPGPSGLDICRDVRSRSAVPIIVLTAKDAEVDKVVGLEVGADDYVTKPFSPRELLARIRATVRRVRGQAGPTQQTVQVGGLVLDPQKMTVTLDGNPIDVTAYEFSILRALAQRPGRVLSREQLLDLAKGSAELSFDRSIDVHVSRLRAKLGDDSRNPKILKTVRGAGYLLAGGDV